MKEGIVFNKNFFDLENKLDLLFNDIKTENDLLDLKKKLDEMIVYYFVERRELIRKGDLVKSEMLQFYSQFFNELKNTKRDCVSLDDYINMIEPFVEKTIKEKIQN